MTVGDKLSVLKRKILKRLGQNQRVYLPKNMTDAMGATLNDLLQLEFDNVKKQITIKKSEV